MPDAPAEPIAATTTTPIAPPAHAPSEPARPRGRRAVQITAVVATVGVLLALAGLASSARPLSTPTQDCGTALTYLTQGRVNEFVDPDDPPAGVTKAEALANEADPCQERAANRARPAGALVIGGTLLALVALIVEGFLRHSINRAARRSWLTPGPPGLPPPPAAAPPPSPPPAY